MYINYCLYSEIADTCWARANGWTTPALFRWCVRPQNRTEHCLTELRSMLLATPGIVAVRVCRDGPRRSSGHGSPPSPLCSPRKLCCLLQKIIKTRRSGYLFNKFYVGLATKALGFCMVDRPKTLLPRSYIYMCVCVWVGVWARARANLVEGTIWPKLADKSLKALSALRLLFLGENLSSKMSVWGMYHTYFILWVQIHRLIHEIFCKYLTKLFRSLE